MEATSVVLWSDQPLLYTVCVNTVVLIREKEVYLREEVLDRVNKCNKIFINDVIQIQSRMYEVNLDMTSIFETV